MRLNILTISSTFPNPDRPQLGTFVAARLEHLAEYADVTVIAPIPRWTYSGNRRAAASAPPERQSGRLRVFHPRYIYPPLNIPFNGLVMSAQIAGLARRLHQERPFNLIDSHFAIPDGQAAAAVAAGLKLPFAVTLRGVELQHNLFPARRRAMVWALKRAALVIGVSEPLRQLAISLGVAAARTLTIPNGVDSTLFYPRDRTDCRRKYELPAGRRIILGAGALLELKGFHLMIDATDMLVRAGHDVCLAIAGSDGGYGPVLRSRVQALGLGERVRFFGHVQPVQLAELMSAADLFCLGSSREGWPNVVHESLSCGTPVIATNVGAVPEMLPNPEYGTIVPSRDAESLFRAMAAGLEKDWDRSAIAQWGRARGWEAVAKELHSAFLKIAR
jgi:teichuronic acid biosynthesis glycosyltransferase TuaC